MSKVPSGAQCSARSGRVANMNESYPKARDKSLQNKEFSMSSVRGSTENAIKFMACLRRVSEKKKKKKKQEER